MAGRLVNRLGSSFQVYEAEPGVFDLYVDEVGPVFDALEGVTPAWATYLRYDSAPAGWASQLGPFGATRTP